MTTPRRLLSALALTLLALHAAAAAEVADAWQGKIDPWVLDTAGREGAAEFLVVLDAQADLADARDLATKEARGRYVFERLRRTAAGSQPPVLAELARLGALTRPFWIANMIWVRGDAAVAEAMARRADVRRVAANPWVALEAPGFDRSLGTLKGGCPPGGIVEGVAHTGAPDLWAQGADGTGAVVAGEDTGYDWDHEALIDAYRGWDGASVDHDYNWHDAIHSGGGSCGADSPEPCDDHFHGTHTMGTMVGQAGAATLGMAPGARWIGCRNMDQGNGTPATYAECFEFFLAPTDSNGLNPDPSKAPDVVNNSWSCPPSEGCTDVNVLKTVVENLRTAGVVIVVSAGNSGSGCSSVSTPAAIYDASFSIGATDLFSDSIAGFSSRGPVTADGSGRLKPDVSAPGVSVCSSFPSDNYGTLSGTSMSGPHVAGLVALLISAQPCLRGQVDAIEQYIMDTAVPRTTTQECGGIPGSEVPNNTYGWGAIRAVLPGPEVCTNGLIFADGFESGDTSGWPG
jgi:serine protease AprX